MYNKLCTGICIYCASVHYELHEQVDILIQYLKPGAANTVDRENFVIKKATWDKTLTHFNFIRERIVCTSTKDLHY